jgi:hypothetical protein
MKTILPLALAVLAGLRLAMETRSAEVAPRINGPAVFGVRLLQWTR